MMSTKKTTMSNACFIFKFAIFEIVRDLELLIINTEYPFSKQFPKFVVKKIKM
jgi:hypothetical protein